MGVPKDLHLPDEVEETGFAPADIARIQKALRATRYECKSNNHRKPVNSHVSL
jgi:hypothetical protein